MGVSTKVLDDNRAGAQMQEFPLDQSTCYAKTKEALVKIGAYIYHKDQGMIALYVSETDTTPVGIYFTSMGPTQTKLEFSSPSTFAKEFIARRVGLRLEGKKDELFPDAVVKEEKKAVEAAPTQTKRLQEELQN